MCQGTVNNQMHALQYYFPMFFHIYKHCLEIAMLMLHYHLKGKEQVKLLATLMPMLNENQRSWRTLLQRLVLMLLLLMAWRRSQVSPPQLPQLHLWTENMAAGVENPCRSWLIVTVRFQWSSWEASADGKKPECFEGIWDKVEYHLVSSSQEAHLPQRLCLSPEFVESMCAWWNFIIHQIIHYINHH